MPHFLGALSVHFVRDFRRAVFVMAAEMLLVRREKEDVLNLREVANVGE